MAEAMFDEDGYTYFVLRKTIGVINVHMGVATM